jgi:uncharacterized membrane protein
MLGRFMLAIAAVAAAGVVVAGPVAAQEDRSFSIDRFEVEASVDPDGSMDVVEHLTYTFDGTFNVGDRDIPAGEDYRIVDMQASENGQPLETINTNPASFEWDLGGATGTHTYDISYTVEDAVAVGPDVGELYWQFIGTEFPAVGEVDISITFPGDGDGLRAWAHGPLDGVVEIDGNEVTLTVDGLPAGEFV